jgi:hypothetical protein
MLLLLVLLEPPALVNLKLNSNLLYGSFFIPRVFYTLLSFHSVSFLLDLGSNIVDLSSLLLILDVPYNSSTCY